MLPLEENEQATVARWLEAHGIRFQASAMGSYMHPATFLKAKKMGCQAGHPDLIIYDRPTPVENGTLYVGTCIEMKRRKGGVVSEDQKEWLAALEERGWKCKVALGCDDAISFLEACGYRDRR
jgi:hypothetical protein